MKTKEKAASSGITAEGHRPPAWLSLSALTFVSAIWGYSFLLVHDAVACYPVFLFLALRFTLAALIMVPFMIGRLRHMNSATLLGGFLMGLALFSGYALQSTGLLWTSASHSGFITGLFVVFTPLFHAILRRKFPTEGVLAAVTFSVAGLALLSWTGSLSTLNIGDLLSLACAAVYAVHLLLTSRMAVRYDTASLVIVQISTVALLSWIFSVPALSKVTPVPAPALYAIIVTAFLATVLAYYVQTSFQKHTSAVQTAIIFTLEPVFAGLSAVLFGGERLGLRGLSGGFMILIAMFIGQVAEMRHSAEYIPV